jgi:tRNA threonylcarbamoyladenosine biosynthesis protein TsaB
LAFDSTAKVASVAVMQNERILASYSIDNGLTQSELLLPMAEGMLKNLGIAFSDVGLFAASVGPGSFTGVRIGVSLVKGLAFGKGTPCVAVDTLEALAENLAGVTGIIIPVMNARRGQVYTSLFSSDGEKIERLTEDMALKIDELEKILPDYVNVVFVGDGARLCHSKLGYEIAPAGQLYQRGSSVAFAAEKSFSEEKTVTAAELMPAYLRLPQAERELKARLSSK